MRFRVAGTTVTVAAPVLTDTVETITEPVIAPAPAPIAPPESTPTPPVTSGGLPTFTHRQETSATVWNITHNLNRKPVSVVVYSLDYSVLWEGVNLQPMTDNTCRITFDDPITGIALIY